MRLQQGRPAAYAVKQHGFTAVVGKAVTAPPVLSNNGIDEPYERCDFHIVPADLGPRRLDKLTRLEALVATSRIAAEMYRKGDLTKGMVERAIDSKADGAISEGSLSVVRVASTDGTISPNLYYEAASSQNEENAAKGADCSTSLASMPSAAMQQ